MGHYKLWIVILKALDTIWCRVVLAAIPDWASSGHLRRCSNAATTNQYLSRVKDASILSWPTIMGHYKLWIVILEALDTIWCRVVLAAIPNWASSGHLRRCSDVVATNKYLSR
eukprot:scaffold10020_cov153-Skeletonema_dohrnii-CCMP3373.AAC.3